VKITLRPYRAEDFDTLYRIDHACYPPEIAYSRADMRAYLGFGGSECVVAEISEDAVQAKQYERRNIGDARLTDDTRATIAGFCIGAYRGKDGYIVTMDVLEEYRRRGIATALLNEIEGSLAARGVKRIALETATNNDAGVAFWRRHGYRTRSVRKGYYPGGGDAYAMTKTLRVAK
jgi:ribosomal protein S18 acetylase RimI-like enzyme